MIPVRTPIFPTPLACRHGGLSSPGSPSARPWRRILGCLSALVAVGASTAGAVTINHAADITADEVWEAADVHRISGPVRVVEGVTLTIEPGSVVKFNWQQVMTVDGTLVASGTPEDPILFTSDEDDTGHDGILGTDDDDDTNGNGPSNGRAGVWGNIVLGATSTNVAIEHGEFRFAGGWNGLPTLHIRGGEPVVRNCSFLGGNGFGVRIEGASPVLTGGAFRNNRTAPFSMNLASNPTISGVTLEGHPVNGMLVDAGEISEDATWNNPDVVYQLAGGVTVMEGATLTIGAGQVIKSSQNSVHRLNVNGAIITHGTMEQPVVFTSNWDDSAGGDTNNDGEATLPTRDSWGGITLGADSTGNVLRHTEIRFTGRNGHGLHVNGAELVMAGGAIRSSGGFTSGLRIDQSDPTITGVSITNHLGSALSMDLNSEPKFTNLEIRDNQWNGIWVAAGELAEDTLWDNPEVVYLLSGSITVPEGVTFTLGAGQVVKAPHFTGHRFTVNGTIVANGTAARPVVFTETRDDSAGEDTNNDGTASSPTTDGWGGITLSPGSTGNILRQTEIRHTGRNGHGLHVNGAELTMTGGVIRTSGLHTSGLRIDQSDPVVTDVFFTGHLGAAISMDLASRLTLTGCSLENNQWNGAWLDTGELPGDAAWDEADVVFILSGAVTVPEGVTLRLGPGQVVKGRTNTQDRLIVNGTLLSTGTPAQPVVLTDLNDDTAGGDTNNNGGASVPPRGGWAGIVFSSSSTNCVLEHTTVRFGGRDGFPGVLADGADVELSNCLIADSFLSGVVARNGATVRVSNSLILNHQQAGLHAESGASITAINNTIDGDGFSNFDTGVSLTTATATLTNNIITNHRFAGVSGNEAAGLVATSNIVFNPNAGNGNYHIVEDPTGEAGNLAVDPKYYNRANREYWLRPGSPAIDSATSQDAPATDFAGNPRFDDPNVPNTGGVAPDFYDRGALERQEISLSEVDLFVSGVSGPTVGTPDQVATVEWTVTNAGEGPANGSWLDAIYLSTDATWSPNDLFIGNRQHQGGLGAGQSYQASAQVTLSGIVPGSHYFIVRSNPNGAVFEALATGNNASSSGSTIDFEIPILTIGQPESGQFTAVGESHFYQVNVLPGETLIVSIDSGAASGVTELYLRRGATPSTSVYDFRSPGAYGPDQSVVVPSTQAGAYFVLAHARAGAVGSSAYQIEARLGGFGIVGVSPRNAANSGTVTLTVEGTQLNPDCQVSLISPTMVETSALSQQFGDSTKIHSTFDLNGLPHGLYDVKITKDGQEAIAEDILSIQEGTPASIRTSLTADGFLRPAREGRLVLEYVNEGQTDAVAPLMIIQAENAEIRWLGDRAYSGSIVQVLGINHEGPAGVLPPGARGRVEFAFLPTLNEGLAEFSLNTLEDPSRAVDWPITKDRLRPDAIEPEAWDVTWNQFLPQLGTTLGDYRDLLVANANYLGRLGVYTPNADRLFTFELSQASNLLRSDIVTASADVIVDVPGVPLAFARHFTGNVAARHHLGLLGRGWSHTFDLRAATGAEGDVSIISGLERRIFILHPNGSYVPFPGDLAVLTREGDRLRLREPNGTVLRFREDSRLESVEDAQGNRVAGTYTAGKLTSLQHSSGESLSVAYNAQGRVETIAASGGRTTTYSYDPSGDHLLAVTSDKGTIEYTYDAGTSAAKRHALTVVKHADGSEIRFDYDDLGRLSGERFSDGTEAISFSYDEDAGFIRTDALNNSSAVYVDDFGQLRDVVDPFGNVLRTRYDDKGQLQTLEAPDGSRHDFDHGNQGNVLGITNSLGHRAELVYEPAFGALSRLRDLNGNVTNLAYDGTGSLLSIIHPDGSSEQFSYDAIGNTQESTNRRRQKIRYTHDNQGRLTRKLLPDGSEASFAYDARGNLTEASNGLGVITLTYDSADNLTRINYPAGRFLAYAYDNEGRRIRMDDQDGHSVKYEYDEAGRLARLRDESDVGIVSYTYDLAGRLARQNMGNGTATTFEYDAADQPTRLVNLAPDDSVLSQFLYTYDEAGRVIAEESLDGISNYEYDVTGQLVRADLPDGRIIRYSYDAAGNRTSTVDNGSTTEYTSNNLNQYTRAGDATYDYDSDGNLISKVEGGETWSYSYDSENRLMEVQSPQGQWLYYYDALGQLAGMTANGQTTTYLNDPAGLGDIVAEFDQGGSLAARYLHGAGLVARVSAAGVPAYYGSDSAGNTVHLSSADGSIANSYRYLPYGEPLEINEAIPNPFRYGGQLGAMSNGNGLHYMRARFYDSAIGRFIQTDPIGIEGGSNLYAYAENNPIDQNDTTGLAINEVLYEKALRRAIIRYFEQNHPTLGRLTGNTLKTVVGRLNKIEKAGLLEVQARRLGLNVKRIKESTRIAQGIGRGLAQSARANPNFLKPRSISSFRKASALSRLKGGLGRLFRGAGRLTRRMPILQKLEYSWKAGWAVGTAINTHVLSKETKEWIGEGVLLSVEQLQFWKRFKTVSSVITGRDPNDILGPAGFGDEHWLRPDALLPYTIRFENASDASAAAQEVFLTNELDPDMDLETFELGRIGFGSRTVEVPPGHQVFETTVEAENEDGSPVLVFVRAELDLETATARWTFRSLDPGTGELPADPFAGFLHRNDDTGVGEGFVTYSIRPSSGVATGTRIDNSASIVFDVNDPIPTPPIFNTIDAEPPSSSVTALPAESASPFEVQWLGDDGAGSGPLTYDVFVSDNGGAFEPWLVETSLTSESFTGELGHQYAFYVRATDGVDWQEPPKVAGEASTTVTSTGDPYQLWLEEFFTQAERDAGVITTLTADPDEDGSTNLLEYSALTHPRRSGSIPAFAVAHDLAEVSLAYTRRRNDPSLTFQLEGSPNLVDWEAEIPVTESHEILDEVSERVEAQLEANSEARFYRFTVTR